MATHPAALPHVNLIIPGIDGSCSSHWQSQWEQSRGDCRRVDLGSWNDPEPIRWMARLDDAVRQYRDSSIVLVGHSLGSILVAWWAHHHARSCAAISGAMLVAPCDPDSMRDERLRPFAPVPSRRLPFPVTVVASRNDPYASFEWTAGLARILGATLIDVGQAGHINRDSQLGAWPQGESLLEAVIARTSHDAQFTQRSIGAR